MSSGASGICCTELTTIPDRLDTTPHKLLDHIQQHFKIGNYTYFCIISENNFKRQPVAMLTIYNPIKGDDIVRTVLERASTLTKTEPLLLIRIEPPVAQLFPVKAADKKDIPAANRDDCNFWNLDAAQARRLKGQA